jgi:hypothetical protein
VSDRRAAFDEILMLRPASTALLVIDMQRGHLRAHDIAPGARAVGGKP